MESGDLLHPSISSLLLTADDVAALTFSMLVSPADEDHVMRSKSPARTDTKWI